MTGIDLLKFENFYLVGIKGTGLSALALFLKNSGKTVNGSDSQEKFYTDELLTRHKINFIESYNPEVINKAIEVVIYSTANSLTDNPQLIKAQQLGIAVYSYPEVLGEIIKTKKTVAVAGTHGKTTVTALLGFILKQANLDPSVIVGSKVEQFAGNSLVGQSDILIVETDEYQNKFKYYQPQALVLNNIEWDHPDFFSTPHEYYQTFFEYIKKIPTTGWLVVNLDDSNVARLAKQASCPVITYSLKQPAEWQVKSFKEDENYQYFTVFNKNKLWADVKLKLFGEFNIANALASLAAATKMGVEKKSIISSLASFAGTARRFELKGRYHSSLIIDDFAHHPAEVQATLKMARRKYKTKKIYVVFHPHTYSRTEKLKNDFSKSFFNCNQVIILDIYASAREQTGHITSEQLTKLVNQQSNNGLYLPNIDKAVDYLRNRLNRDSILITMGAGDVWRVGENLLKM